MIEVIFATNGFIVKGHALSDIKGKDLVCAGVSAIIYGGINALQQKNTIVDINKQQTQIKVELKQQELNQMLILQVIKTQLLTIQAKYTNNIIIKEVKILNEN